MDNENKFPEQEAPVKNTDNAFVQVGKDGFPVVPPTDKKVENETPKTNDSPGK